MYRKCINSYSAITIILHRNMEYDLFYTTAFYTKLQIYDISYTIDTVLYQFLETETSERCLICIGHRLRFSGFFYTFFFPLQSL